MASVNDAILCANGRQLLDRLLKWVYNVGVEECGSSTNLFFNNFYWRKKMKTSKRKVLIIVFFIVYFSFGYYYGQSWIDASVKSLNDKPISFFQEVQLGGWEWLMVVDVNDSLLGSIAIILLSVFLWPLALLAAGGSWILYGAIDGTIAIFLGIVSLFEFIFYEELYRLIGPGGFCLIIGLMVVLIVLIVRKFLARERIGGNGA